MNRRMMFALFAGLLMAVPISLTLIPKNQASAAEKKDADAAMSVTEGKKTDALTAEQAFDTKKMAFESVMESIDSEMIELGNQIGTGSQDWIDLDVRRDALHDDLNALHGVGSKDFSAEYQFSTGQYYYYYNANNTYANYYYGVESWESCINKCWTADSHYSSAKTYWDQGESEADCGKLAADDLLADIQLLGD